MSKAISHHERLEICLADKLPDRTPVALWRHFPVDDQDPDRLTEAIVSFQQTFDFDIVKVTPASSFCVKDWGAKDIWKGATEGTREYTDFVIQQTDDWLRLPVLEPQAGHLAKQLHCLRAVKSTLGNQAPIIQTIFSPLAQAKNLVSREKLLVHLRRYPEALLAGLGAIAKSTRLFVEAAMQTGIDGIFYAVQHAQYGLLSEDEFIRFGKTFDLQVLEASHPLWLNMLHLHGDEVMFKLVADYPVDIINWHDRDTAPTLIDAQTLYPGVSCGGLQREKTMVLGSPEDVQREARDAIRMTGGKRFILGTGCVLPITAPYGNIMAARKIVDDERII